MSSLAQCPVCGNTQNLKRCAQCKSIYYCSREHQKQDWSIHKHACSIESFTKNNRELQLNEEPLLNPKNAIAPPYHILAFGDSLTEGYYNLGFKFNPYSIVLQELLDKEFPNQFMVNSMGVSGETTVDMEPRLLNILKNSHQQNGEVIQYSHIIILAGTNDIGKKSSKCTFENLCKLYDHAEKFGIHVIVLTVPQSNFTNDWYVKRRNKLNTKIKEHAKKKNYVVVDIEAEIPYDKLNNLWDDSLHFSKIGYDKMAEIIFRDTKELFKTFLSNPHL